MKYQNNQFKLIVIGNILNKKKTSKWVQLCRTLGVECVTVIDVLH